MKILASSLSIAFALVSVSSLPAFAGDNVGKAIFYCAKNKEGIPITVARANEKRKVILIEWRSKSFQRTLYTPQKRCEINSARFQRNQEAGYLVNIVPGNLKGIPVLCASKDRKAFQSSCTSERVLFTLKPGANPNDVVEEFNRLNTNSSAKPSIQRISALSSDEDGDFSLDVDRLLINSRDASNLIDPDSEPVED
jgi:hypothetical protein